MTDENPALTQPKPTAPPPPWELTIEREDLHKAASLALAVRACADTPDWLRDQADEVADSIGWWLTFGEYRGPGSTVRMIPALMSWQGAYQEMCAEFLLDTPDSVKAKYPLDVILAQGFAEAADTVGFSMDCRLESLDGLHSTLARLKDHADDEADQDDDEEIDDDETQFERSTNHGVNQV
jgi:hypothetical protein